MQAGDAGAPRSRWKRGAIVLAAFAVLGGVGGVVWHKHFKERFFPKRWGVVESGRIYRSGQIHGDLIRHVLEKHGIRTLVCLTGPDRAGHHPVEVAVADELGIERVLLPLGGDGTGDIRHYAAAVEQLHRAAREGEPALVHCAAGSQRTGGVVAAYRVLVQGKSPRLVFDEMKQYDWRPGKDRAVIDYVNGHMEELARLLVEKKVIPRVPDPLPVLIAEE